MNSSTISNRNSRFWIRELESAGDAYRHLSLVVGLVGLGDSFIDIGDGSDLVLADIERFRHLACERFPLGPMSNLEAAA